MKIQEEKRSNETPDEGNASTADPAQGIEKPAQETGRRLMKFLTFLYRLFFVEPRPEEGVEEKGSRDWHRAARETDRGTEAANESFWVRLQGYWRSALRWVMSAQSEPSPALQQRALTYEETYEKRKKYFEDEDLWNVLGLKEGSEIATVNKAYRELVFQHHPDKNPSKTVEATEQCQWMAVAKEKISSGEIDTIAYEIGKLKRQIQRKEQKCEEAEQSTLNERAQREVAEQKREEAEQKCGEAEQKRGEAEQSAKDEREKREALERELEKLKQQLAKSQREEQQEETTGKPNTSDNKSSFFPLPPRPEQPIQQANSAENTLKM